MTRTAVVNGTLVLLLGGFAALQSGCGPLKYNVRSSALAPGADAKLTADVKKRQGQTLLEMEATNLIPPNRVEENGAQYVAWYRPNASGQWNRIGTLDYDEDDRKGSLNGSVPETAFDFQVSVEGEAPPMSPSPQILFSQRVQDE